MAVDSHPHLLTRFPATRWPTTGIRSLGSWHGLCGVLCCHCCVTLRDRSCRGLASAPPSRARSDPKSKPLIGGGPRHASPKVDSSCHDRESSGFPMPLHATLCTSAPECQISCWLPAACSQSHPQPCRYASLRPVRQRRPKASKVARAHKSLLLLPLLPLPPLQARFCFCHSQPRPSSSPVLGRRCDDRWVEDLHPREHTASLAWLVFVPFVSNLSECPLWRVK